MSAISAVAVLVPARDEQTRITRLLDSITASIGHLRRDVQVHTVVACDSCTDDTVLLAAHSGASVTEGCFGTPAAARAAAADLAARLKTAKTTTGKPKKAKTMRGKESATSGKDKKSVSKKAKPPKVKKNTTKSDPEAAAGKPVKVKN